jgi:hypothetical protein
MRSVAHSCAVATVLAIAGVSRLHAQCWAPVAELSVLSGGCSAVHKAFNLYTGAGTRCRTA